MLLESPSRAGAAAYAGAMAAAAAPAARAAQGAAALGGGRGSAGDLKARAGHRACHTMPAMATPASPRAERADEPGRPAAGWRLQLYTVIFEADTRAGRLFDLALVAFILASVLVVVLDSMASVHEQHRRLLNGLEWMFTLLFTAEYIARLACVRHPMRYARSFYRRDRPAGRAAHLPGGPGARAARADRRARAAPAAPVPDPEARRLRRRVPRARAGR